MPPFHFRLQSLLRLREATRDQQRELLADALRVAERLEHELSQLRHQQRQLQHTVRPRLGPVEVDRLLEAGRYSAVLAIEEQRLVGQQRQVDAEVQRRREALVAADREVKVLERLRDQQFERHREEQERRDGHQMDEVAQLRYTFAATAADPASEEGCQPST